MNATVRAWREAVAAGDTFRIDKVGGDRALIARIWKRLKDLGEDPMSGDMLLIRDLEQAINGLVEAHTKLDQLEIILNDLSDSDGRTIARFCEAFYN